MYIYTERMPLIYLNKKGWMPGNFKINHYTTRLICMYVTKYPICGNLR